MKTRKYFVFIFALLCATNFSQAEAMNRHPHIFASSFQGGIARAFGQTGRGNSPVRHKRTTSIDGTENIESDSNDSSRNSSRRSSRRSSKKPSPRNSSMPSSYASSSEEETNDFVPYSRLSKKQKREFTDTIRITHNRRPSSPPIDIPKSKQRNQSSRPNYQDDLWDKVIEENPEYNRDCDEDGASKWTGFMFVDTEDTIEIDPRIMASNKIDDIILSGLEKSVVIELLHILETIDDFEKVKKEQILISMTTKSTRITRKNAIEDFVSAFNTFLTLDHGELTTYRKNYNFKKHNRLQSIYEKLNSSKTNLSRKDFYKKQLALQAYQQNELAILLSPRNLHALSKHLKYDRGANGLVNAVF